LQFVTNDDFYQSISKEDMSVLVNFCASWNNESKTQTRIINELSREFNGRVKFVNLDVDVNGNKDIAVEYVVMSVPTIIIFYNREVKDTMVGVTSKSKLQSKLEQAL
jgi:thioredoxin 1